MKILFVLILSIGVYNCSAQYYSVNDADSFVNVREDASINAAVVCKLPNETIVFASYVDDMDEKSNWVHVDFYLKKTTKKKNPEDYTPAIMNGYTLYSGYIYKTKLIAIEKLKPLTYRQFTNGYSCSNDSVKIKITIAPFVQAKHSVQYSKKYEGIWDKVDNLPMIGSDGSKPGEEIKKMEVSINNITVSIPAAAYKNLFNPSYQNDAYADKNGNIYLVMYNSDAAGSYSCIFIFKNGKFIQRLVFNGEC